MTTPLPGPAGPGPAIDARGQPVLDPTQNVFALVEAAIKRQDDLRELEARHAKEMASLRAELGEKLRVAESNRIDAIRAVDVGATSRAAEVAAAHAATLANQVGVTAETLRNQVQAAADAAAAALDQALEPIRKDIAEMRKVQYEQAGARVAQVETKGTNQWAIGFALSTFLAVLSTVGFVLSFVLR